MPLLRKVCLCLVLIFNFMWVRPASSQQLVHEIKGRITGQSGDPLPFASVFVSESAQGTSANESGWFTLKLPAGKVQITAQYLGYLPETKVLNLPSDSNLLFKLKPEAFQLSELVVDPSFNPALRIMRNAIAAKKKNAATVSAYSCRAYVKGIQKINEAPSRILGRKFNVSGLLTGPNNSGILYLSESVSRLYFRAPDDYKEEVLSSRVSGKSQGYTWNSARDFNMSFYKNYIDFPVIGLRPFVSPLSDRALLYYDFKLLGKKEEFGTSIYTIQITPKRKADPVFSGIIQIADSSWNIRGLRLSISKSNPVQYIDSLTITQYFMPVVRGVWLPAQLRFDAKASFLGVKGEGYYLSVYSDYKLPQAYYASVMPQVKLQLPVKAKKVKSQVAKADSFAPPDFKKQEVQKFADSSNQRSAAYWDTIRPVPLEALEIADFQFRDSLEVIRSTPQFKDSTDRLRNVPGVMSILSGYDYRISKKQIQIHFPSLLSLVNYNTVEGINLKFSIGISKSWEKRSRLSAYFTGRYAFSNRMWNGKARISWMSDRIHRERWDVEGGVYISQFNELQPQSELGNTFNTLFFRWNYMKIYRQQFVRLNYQREIAPGILLKSGLYYARRSPLENTSFYSFFYRKASFTWNGMDLPDTDSGDYNISRHQLLRFDLSLRIRFGSRYISRPDMRLDLQSPFPVLSLQLKQAIPINKADFLAYTYLQADLDGDIDAKVLGYLAWKITAGWFPWRGRVDYPEFRHFSGVFYNEGTRLLGFHLIRYYRFSTDRFYAEAHFEHHFGGFFFNKIPGFRKLKLQEVLGFHFLYDPTRNDYFQLDAGIENIFKVLRVDMVVGLSRKTNYYIGARIGTLIGGR